MEDCSFCKKTKGAATQKQAYLWMTVEVEDMKKRRHIWFHKEKGQAVVEAALVIPLIILILCGIIDFGWIFSNQLSVNNFSREGVRYAIVNSKDANLAADVTAKVRAMSDWDDSVTVSVQFASDQDISVTVTKPVKVLTPIAGIFYQNQVVQLKSTSTMRIG